MSNPLADMDKPDVIFCIGTNMTECHPVAATRLKRALARGAKMIVADPRRIGLAEIADVYLPIRVGSDVSLLLAMAHVIAREGVADEDFMGASRLLDVLCFACDLPRSLADATRGSQQYQDINRAVAQNKDLPKLIKQLEAYYDKMTGGAEEREEGSSFSPEVEEFLKSMGERLDGGKESPQQS